MPYSPALSLKLPIYALDGVSLPYARRRGKKSQEKSRHSLERRVRKSHGTPWAATKTRRDITTFRGRWLICKWPQTWASRANLRARGVGTRTDGLLLAVEGDGRRTLAVQRHIAGSLGLYLVIVVEDLERVSLELDDYAHARHSHAHACALEENQVVQAELTHNVEARRNLIRLLQVSAENADLIIRDIRQQIDYLALDADNCACDARLATSDDLYVVTLQKDKNERAIVSHPCLFPFFLLEFWKKDTPMVKVQRLGPSAHAVTNPLDFFQLSSRIANPKPKSRHPETSYYLVKVLFDLGELKRQLVLDGLVPRLDDDCVLVDSIDESEKVPQLT